MALRIFQILNVCFPFSLDSFDLVLDLIGKGYRVELERAHGACKLFALLSAADNYPCSTLALNSNFLGNSLRCRLMRTRGTALDLRCGALIML